MMPLAGMLITPPKIQGKDWVIAVVALVPGYRWGCESSTPNRSSRFPHRDESVSLLVAGRGNPENPSCGFLWWLEKTYLPGVTGGCQSFHKFNESQAIVS